MTRPLALGCLIGAGLLAGYALLRWLTDGPEHTEPPRPEEVWPENP